MSFEVRYSIRAVAEYEEILDYVSEKFGLATAAKVDSHFEDIIAQIAINPLLYPVSNKDKSLRRCVISPQTTLYYRFTGKYVELISYRGSRMNPGTLKL
jgi:plasmid stabilization system protein ParE